MIERADLELVVALADAGSITAAADRLHVAQPALSRRLARIERHVGGPLMERSRRGTVPTPAGRLFVERSRQLLRDLDRTERDVAAVAAGRGGSLRLGATPTLGSDLLPDVLGALRARNPEVSVDLTTDGDSERLRAGVRSGALDVAVAVIEPRVEDGLVVAAAGSQPFALVLPADHRLARRRTVPIAELAELPFVALRAGQGLRVLLDGVLAELGHRPSVVLEADERELLLPLVAAGLGAALVPEAFARARAGVGVVVRPIGPPVARRVGVVLRSGSGRSPVVAQLLDVISEHDGWTIT